MHSLKIIRTAENENSANRAEYLSLKLMGLSKGNRRGFTLVELLIVVAIISILATVAMNSFSAFQNKAREVRCAGEIRGLEKNITDYAIQKGGYPANYAELVSFIGKGELIDPWGNNYVYRPFGDPTEMRYLAGDIPLNTDFDLYSKGMDGASDLFIQDPLSDDDIIRGGNGSFVGSALKYLN